MSDKVFLDNIKEGDVVIVHSRSSNNLVTVNRITKTMIIVQYSNGYEKRFRKNGTSIGTDVWSGSNLIEPTVERVNEIRRKNKAAKVNFMLKKINPVKLSVEELDNLLELLPKLMKDKTKEG